MIECYYNCCNKHVYWRNDTEPFCVNDECTATAAELKMFEAFRQNELRKNNETNYSRL